MTVLAKVDLSLNQQRIVSAAMRGVADHTVLFNRCVLPDERAALVCVTLVAEQVVALCFHHVRSQGAVRVVAVGATHFAFDDRMMRDLVSVGTNILMTAKAGLGLIDFWCC